VDTKKKSLAASERNEEERANWRKQMSQQEADQLVFLDECGSNSALTPLYGRAPKGERAHGSVPRNRGKNTTLIASLSLEGIGASMILEGGVNALAFETYIEQILAPGLQPRQIVVMDNLQVHKGAHVQQLIEKRAAICSFCLPIPLISLLLKRRSRRSRRSYDELKPEHEKHLKKRSLKHYSPLLPRMLADGFVTAATPCIRKTRPNNFLPHSPHL